MATVVFDLDGTLADTSGDLIAAANHVLRARGVGDGLDPATDAATAFQGGRAMLRLGFARGLGAVDEREVEAGYPALLEAYAGALAVHTRLYPGAAAALARLRAAGYRTAVCTNKPAALAERLIASLGLAGMLDGIVGADTLPVRKPDPAPLAEAVRRAGGPPGQAVLVGDTETDRATARNAGVPSVLVTFGPAGRGVTALAPEALLDDYDALDAVLAPLLVPA